MKKLVILSAFLFTLLSCKQNAQNEIKEVNITVKVDEGIVLKDEKPIKTKSGNFWKEIKNIATSKIEAKKEYAFLEWRLKDESGKPLSEDLAFNEDEVVYAVSKQVENKARINITGDERVSISGDAFIELDILVPKTFKDVEAKIKEKLSLKPEWNNGDYDFFDWKLNDENGKLILQDTPIDKEMTVFARTNYTKFKIEDTTIFGYEGEKPRGRIIIPKEITNFRLGDTGITSIDMSHNPELTVLHLDDTQITSIDVSHNQGLEWLYLSRTQIKSIDVSHNPKLEWLYLRKTQITSIDVSRNQKLSILGLSETQITSIDVSRNQKLSMLGLSETQITSIDVSHNPELGYVSFEGCSLLNEVDLSTCSKLSSLGDNNFKGAINAVVTLPSSIKRIDNGIFGDNEANYCKKIIVPNNEIKQLVKASGYPEERIEVKP